MTKARTDAPDLTAPPLYVVTADWVAVLGIPHPKGAKFTSPGWPMNGVAPLNESARRIFDYWKIHQHNAFRPGALIDSDLGTIFLPAAYFDPRSVSLRALEPGHELPGMPLYRMGDNAPGWMQQDPRFPHYKPQPGDVFAILSWPGRLDGLEPANAEAGAVVSYFDANRANPKLKPAPWCEYRRALVLPPLPEMPKARNAPAAKSIPRFAPDPDFALLTQAIVRRGREQPAKVA